MLLHQRFNDPEAADLFREALSKGSIERRGIRRAWRRFPPKTSTARLLSIATKAIELDPKLAAAHELLADLALTNDDRELAAAEADKAIAFEADCARCDGDSRRDRDDCGPRLPMHGSRGFRPSIPHYGEGYALVAHQLELHYRYEDAVTYYRKAVEADPRLWAAHSALGIELMRLGQEDEPYKELELSYNNGYRDAATVNSLRLIDSYKNFETIRDDATILKLNKSEVGSAAALHAGGAAHHPRHLRKEVQHEPARAGAARGLSRPRRFRSAHHGHARPRRARRDIRRSRRDGQPFRAQARRLQLGRDDVARDEPRLHPHCHQPSRAALVY